MNNLYNMKNLTIEPFKGYGDIKFGMSIEDIVNIFGEPSNNEELESIIEENENYSILYDYDDECMSICFEGVNKTIVASISTCNEDATLFGERVYEMDRKQIIDLMKRNGYKDYDEEEHHKHRLLNIIRDISHRNTKSRESEDKENCCQVDITK